MEIAAFARRSPDGQHDAFDMMSEQKRGNTWMLKCSNITVSVNEMFKTLLGGSTTVGSESEVTVQSAKRFMLMADFSRC